MDKDWASALPIRYFAWALPIVLLCRACPERWRKPLLALTGAAAIAHLFSPSIAAALTISSLLLHVSIARRVRVGVEGPPWAGVAVASVLFYFIYGSIFLRYGGDYILPEDVFKVFLLVVFAKKSIYYLWESSSGRMRPPELVDSLVYFLAVPFLTETSPVFAFSHVTESYGRKRASHALTDGARTTAWALAHTLLFMGLHRLHAGIARRILVPGTVATAVVLCEIYLSHYLRTYGAHQLGVGVARALGYDIRDNFVRPLTAPSYAEYWRRWNVHMREMVLGICFYPVLLRLTRAAPDRPRRNAIAAACAAFLGHAALNALYVFALVRPGAWRLLGRGLFLLALYEASQFALVGISLLLEGETTPAERSRRSALSTAAGIASTFLLRAASLPVIRAALRPHRGSVWPVGPWSMAAQ
ncbi:MAG: hypothetical protein HY078_07885 [Elusimicrobia bacterium]|nr:hypothetical protein [Elusimicrobiota bacterium]